MKKGALALPQVLSVKESEALRGNRRIEEIVADLYAKLRPPLVGYVYHIVGSAADAEDLVQVVFLKLFDELTRRAEIQNLRGWLYSVAHNLAINHLRKPGARTIVGLESIADRETKGRSSEDEMIRREMVEQALAMLNEKERHSLMLRAEGLSYQEIGDVLEISAKSVSVYLARGLKKFESKHEKPQ